MNSLLNDCLLQMNIDHNEDCITKLNEYYKMLIKKNTVMNLTAITEYDEVVIKHFIDSIAISQVFDMNHISNIIDIGTGAGFPGIVLKIFYPEANFTLLDSLNKRINFLNEVISALNLSKINAEHGRAEDFARLNTHREHYDLCVSRAVANLSTLAEYSLPFVKVGGYFISYKAEDCIEEVNSAKNAIYKLGGEIVDTVMYKIPNSDITRAFVIIKKVNHTSGKYPRKAGLPAKEPLC